jgi:hypothetical protein
MFGGVGVESAVKQKPLVSTFENTLTKKINHCNPDGLYYIFSVTDFL